jgi:hypothetical protein
MKDTKGRNFHAGCPHQRAANWHICPGHHSSDPSETCSQVAAKRKADQAKHNTREGWLEDFPLGHPFCIGLPHFPKDGGMYIQVEQAPCAIRACGRSYEEHLTPEAYAEHKKPKRHFRCSEDMLSKPCPECGYKFGTAWLDDEGKPLNQGKEAEA